MNLEALRDVSVFASQSAADRARLVTSVAEALGPPWGAEQTTPHRLGLVHRPTGLSFVVVAGGEFEMGLTKRDEAAVQKHVPLDDELARWFEKVSGDWRPSHRVQVRPFVVMRSLLSRQDIERVGGRLQGMTTGQDDVRAPREECRRLSHDLGFRLPSEAELEWLFRDGDRYTFTLDALRFVQSGQGDSRNMPSRFGAEELFDGEWAEDDRHDGYDGAPATSDPWVDGGDFGVHRGGALPEYADEPQQMLPLVACMRYPEQEQPPGLPEREHMRLALPIDA